jgi:fumarate reductase flavoprotein subunit
MATAITAVEGGAKVIVLEKRPFPGGASNTPTYLGVVRKDPAYRDKAFQVHMEMTRWTANPQLVRNWVNMTGELIEWLPKQGVEFSAEPVLSTPLEKMGTELGFGGGFPKGYSTLDVYLLKAEGKGHGGATMIKALVKRAKELGVDLRLGTAVKQLLHENGVVRGVIAEGKEGQVRIDAKAVVLASGGFGDNPEMLSRYNGYGMKYDPDRTARQGRLFMLCSNLKLTGECIQMAWEAGAAPGGMGVSLMKDIPDPGIRPAGNAPWISLNQMRPMAEQPYLWVNQNGERFIDEGFGNDHFTMGQAIARQKDHFGTLIFDANTAHYLETHGPDLQYFVWYVPVLEDIEGQFRKTMELGNPHTVMADSLEELATRLDIDPNALRRTVDDYNKCCDQGRDTLFCKDPKYLQPVRKPKFFALRHCIGAYGSIGGIKTNADLQAVTPDLDPIPGLYAAGDVTIAGLYGDPPLMGTAVVSFALASGRIAAQAILRELASEHAQAELASAGSQR